MSSERFEHLLQLSGQKLKLVRKSISAAERVALTLRYLASGDSPKSLSFAFRIGTTTVSNIIKKTCIVLKDVLTDKFVKTPRCETD